MFNFKNIDWSHESFPLHTLLFRYSWNPAQSSQMGHMLDLTIDYCQLLLHNRDNLFLIVHFLSFWTWKKCHVTPKGRSLLSLIFCLKKSKIVKNVCQNTSTMQVKVSDPGRGGLSYEEAGDRGCPSGMPGSVRMFMTRYQYCSSWSMF